MDHEQRDSNQKKRKNYFDCSQSHQKYYKKLIIESELTDLKRFCKRIGLHIDEIKMSPHVKNRDKTKISISPRKISKDFTIYKWMEAKDVANISRQKYLALKETLSFLNFGQIPGRDAVFKYQHQLNGFFKLKTNDFGFFVNPAEKIRFVCEKFLFSNENHFDKGDNKFRIKLSADLTTLSRKNVKLLNFTFSLLNDEKNSMSVFGTYIFGKSFLLMFFN